MSSDIKTFAKILKLAGVEYIVGIVGGGPSIRLVNELIKEDIFFIHSHHEGSASIIAGAINRSSEKKAISISIKGPGLINMLVGISFNNFERINSISISEEYSDPKDKNKLHKRINHTNLLKQFTKSIYSYGYIIKNRDEFIEDINSLNARPVHISLSNQIYKKINKISSKSKLLQDFNSITKKLETSKKPVLIVGKNMLNKFKGLIEKLQFPFFSTVSGLGIIKSGNLFYAGVFTGEGSNNSIEKNIISESDLLIFFGVYGNEVTGKVPNSPKNVSFDFNSEYIEKPLINKTLYFNEEKIKEMFLNNEKNWGKSVLTRSKQIEKNTILKNQWLPSKCFNFINKEIEYFNLILDTGSFAVIAEHIFELDNGKNRKYFGSSNSRFMGTSLPTAIGVSIASREFPTICILGDGGISPYISEIKIISELNLPILLLFISNGGYGSIDFSAPKNSSIKALYFNNPSWEFVIKGFGINTFKCDNYDSYAEILKNWDNKTPIFIECKFEKNNYKMMTKDIR